MGRRIILLGPQPEFKSLREALARLDLGGAVAMITAGWEEGEGEDHALRLAIADAGRADVINLALFHRTERVFAEEPEFIQLLKQRQDELRILRKAYNTRLNLLLTAARGVLRIESSVIDLSREQESSIDMIRQLDDEYLERTGEVCEHYERVMTVDQRPSVVAHRNELGHLLAQCSALVIAGGHAAIILNRLKIFGILEMHPTLPIIAWSGGAMALANQIVFFHDSPPQGPGNPEVCRAGMSAFADILPLPDARRRLRLDDRQRVALFARRFNGYSCVVFDPDTIMEHDGDHWTSHEGIQRLDVDGTLKAVG